LQSESYQKKNAASQGPRFCCCPNFDERFTTGRFSGDLFMTKNSMTGNTSTKLGARIRHPKRRGEWAEMCFMMRAAELGLEVSKPWGETARYDFLVERGGHTARVQVKSSIARQKNAYQRQVHDGGNEPYVGNPRFCGGVPDSRGPLVYHSHENVAREVFHSALPRTQALEV
jgi:hypothetical protein